MKLYLLLLYGSIYPYANPEPMGVNVDSVESTVHLELIQEVHMPRQSPEYQSPVICMSESLMFAFNNVSLTLRF